MKISELGEFGLIDRLSRLVSESEKEGAPAKQNLIIGMGDDAAAWRGDTSIQLVTADSLVQDVHFRLDLTSWEALGWRAMAANLSDIAAMGGLPRYAIVTLSLPGSTDSEDIVLLYKGMLDLTDRYGTVIVGGDVTEAPVIVISITVVGNTPDNNSSILTRSAAVPGDVIAVTGHLGASAAGLELLKTGRGDEARAEALRQAFLHPIPRIEEGQLLVRNGVKAAIDISDGLVADLGHICEASRVGARVETGLIPVHPDASAIFGERALDFALAGGEDYELLFTAPAPVTAGIRDTASCPVTVIGRITESNPGEVSVYGESGELIKPSATGWKHFSQGS